MTTYQLEVMAGLTALAIACLVAAGLGYTHWLWRQRHRVEPHAGQHRVLPPAPVEVLRRLADEPTVLHPVIQERTEEMPRVETPVVHVEVSETSTPLADVFIPLDAVVDDGLPHQLAEHVTASAAGDARHLGRIDGALRGYRARLDASGANAVIDRWLRDAGELPGLVEARRAAYPDCDDPSIEMDAAELAALVAEAKAGAR